MGIHAVIDELSKLFTIIPNTIKKKLLLLLSTDMKKTELLTEKNLLLYKCFFFKYTNKKENKNKMVQFNLILIGCKKFDV